jgi:hypothetical protein
LSSPQPRFDARLIYFVVLIVGALLTVVMAVGAVTTHKERSESISDIKADFDKHILGTFEMPSRIEATVKAMYGLLDDRTKQADVTPTVAARLKDGRLDFIVGLSTMGCDPQSTKVSGWRLSTGSRTSRGSFGSASVSRSTFSFRHETTGASVEAKD